MLPNPRKVSASGSVIVLLVLLSAIVLENAYIFDERWYWCLFVTIPAIAFVALFVNSNRIDIE